MEARDDRRVEVIADRSLRQSHEGGWPVIPEEPKADPGAAEPDAGPHSPAVSIRPRNPAVPEAGAPGSHSARCSSRAHHAKWANALLASAMRWTFSRRVIAAPSRLYAAISSSASFSAM